MITGQRPVPPTGGRRPVAPTGGSRRPPAGRPPGRRGSGGIGPGPAYRPSRTGGGTTHGSSTGTRGMAYAAALMFGVPAALFVGIVVWLVLAR